MENVNAEEEIRDALAKLDRQRKSIIFRSFLRLLIPIGVAVFVTWYSSTIIKETHVLKAANAEQAQTITQITDTFFKLTGELNTTLDSLKAQNASLEEKIAALKQQLERSGR